MLEAPEQDYAPEIKAPRRTSATPNRKLRRDFSEDFAEDFADDFAEEDDAPGHAAAAGWRAAEVSRRVAANQVGKDRGGLRGAGLPGALCGGCC